MKRKAVVTLVFEKRRPFEDIARILKIDPLGRVADISIGKEMHRMARIDKGFDAQDFKETEIAADPEHSDMW